MAGKPLSSYTGEAMVKKTKKHSYFKRAKSLTLSQVFPYILIFCAIIGFSASFILIQDHIELIKNPSKSLICDLNPVLACGPVMLSKPATVLGFPNPIMGLASFAVMGFLGLVILAGGKMKSWFWKLYSLSIIGSLGFMLYLMYESLFVIKAICIYCLSVWIVLILSSWYTFLYMLDQKHIKSIKLKRAEWLRKHYGEILVTVYLVLLFFILREFWYYYGPKLGF